MSLKRAALSGVKWTLTSTGLSTVIQFVQVAVLARLLEPADFGLMAMVWILLNFSLLFMDMGIGQAIIQKQDISREQLSSLYWANIIIGFIVFGFTVSATPLVVALYSEPRLYTLTPAAALLLGIVPFGAQFQLLLQKELRFKTLAVIEIIGAVVAATVAISAAFAGQGVFSLVFGQLSGGAISTLLLVITGWGRWRPTLHFRRADLKGLIGFGFYQLGERVLNLLFSRTDQLLIGALLGPLALGYYSLAWNLVILPSSKINPVLTRVAFPLFAGVQNEIERLRRGYMILLRVVSSVNAPILFGCAATAPTLVVVVYGEQWTPAIPLVQLLAGVGLLRSMINPIGTLLLARGRADLGFMWSLITVPLQIPVVYLGLRIGGLNGIAFGLLCLQIFDLFAIYLFQVRLVVGPCFRQYIASTFPSLGIGAVMAVVVYSLPIVITASPVIVLGAQVAAGVVVYSVLTLMFQRPWLWELLTLLGIGVAPQRIP